MKKTVLRGGIPNANGRIYPPALLEKVVEAYQNNLPRLCCIECPSPIAKDKFASIDLNKAAFEITSLEFNAEKNELMGMIKPLATPEGIKLTPFIEDGSMTIRPYGVGDFDKDGNMTEYTIIGFAAYPKDQVV